MTPPPSKQAVGKPVTLRLRDGHLFHGTLVEATADSYILQQVSGERAIARRDVATLKVREFVS